MVKYITIIAVILISALLYINKDAIFARYSGNLAETSGASVTYPKKYTLTKIVTGNGGAKKSVTTTTQEKPGTQITIAAPMAIKGYKFINWSGACTGNGTCKVTMNSNKTVTAHFASTGCKITKISKDEYIAKIINSNTMTPEEKKRMIETLQSTDQSKFSWSLCWEF